MCKKSIWILALSLGLGSVAQANPLVPQISEDIDTALRKRAQARSLEEFKSSGYTPDEIFRNVSAFKTPRAWEALCQKLLTLSPAQLEMFRSEISRPEHVQQLPCEASLRQKLASNPS